jgi:hypothetical protein
MFKYRIKGLIPRQGLEYYTDEASVMIINCIYAQFTGSPIPYPTSNLTYFEVIADNQDFYTYELPWQFESTNVNCSLAEITVETAGLNTSSEADFTTRNKQVPKIASLVSDSTIKINIP